MNKKTLLLIACFCCTFFQSFPCCTGSSNELLKALESGYFFMKSYSIDNLRNNREKIEYTAILEQGREYNLSFNDKNYFKKKAMRVSILTSRRDTVVSATMHEHKKGVTTLQFIAPYDGIYYLNIQTGKYSCGSALLAFKKKNTRTTAIWSIRVLQPETATRSIVIWEKILEENHEGKINVNFRFRDEQFFQQFTSKGLSAGTLKKRIEKALFKQYGLECAVKVRKI